MCNQSRMLTSAKQLLTTWYLPLQTALRGELLPATSMHEHNSGDGNCQFPERFLQALWNEQRFRQPLQAVGGQRLEVVSPGTWNVAAGPDFLKATILVDGQPQVGDVEVHRQASDWWAHGHAEDAAYRQVVLHVVWRPLGAVRPGAPPLEFCVRDHVRDSLKKLSQDLDLGSYSYARQVSPGRCSAPLAGADDEEVLTVLRAAGLARLANKSARLFAALTAKGAGQALYEAFLGAVGYRANQVAFKELASAVPLDELAGLSTPLARQAALFGTAGLLPDPTTVPVAADLECLARALWDAWWTLGGEPREIGWRRGGGRPLNSPERRLAGACEWLARCHFDPRQRLLQMARQHAEPAALVKALIADLQFASAWDGWMNFQVALKRPARLIGDSRARDIAVNVFIPFIHALATRAGEAEMVELAEAAWLLAPRLQDNRQIKEAMHRLFVPPSRGLALIHHAGEQQGLIELYRSFCQSCGGDCDSCGLLLMLGVEKGQAAAVAV